ncbi:MAG TPA: GAF domain-containing protein [Ktedonobacteraceae bacterium]|nr:GAF domain-containing protein [Ktedonobacteraceae bacterium]
MHNKIEQRARAFWRSPGMLRCRATIAHWQHIPFSGTVTLLVGTLLTTIVIWGFDHLFVVLPDPGLIYLPLVAMLAYHWRAWHAMLAVLLQLLCVYFFFLSPSGAWKPLTAQCVTQLLTLAGVTGFVLALVQLARERRSVAEHEATRLAALNRIGAALTSELDEGVLLHLIAETARDLTHAEFSAFTLRPIDDLGYPEGPSEGSFFHLAAVVGVTPQQEQLLRRMQLGGEGLLAPIFRQGIPVRIADALALAPHNEPKGGSVDATRGSAARSAARRAAFNYAHGYGTKDDLRYLGVPRGHPVMRSFLGAPLLNHERQVIGGLLLGHTEPDQFTQDDETLLIGLTAQAGIALENARLYRTEQMHAQQWMPPLNILLMV